MNYVRKILGINDIHERGIKGRGVTIAILDTGVSEHKDLIGRIVKFYDVVNKRIRMYDDNGHGTHIAGICAGNGRASYGKYTGVCPEAGIISVKVLDENGKGKEEDVIRAAEWIVDNKVNFGINIVNISFGTVADENDIENSPMVMAVEKMWDAGIVVVAAAGNNGPGRGTITSPGISKKIITVGAMDDLRRVSINGKYVNEYSGTGPTKECIVKPDLIAPATMVMSCGCKKDRRNYVVKSGTSMAAPVVTGCIGLLLSKYPELRNYEVKSMLRDTCQDRKLPRNRQGYGLINPIKLLEK